MTPQDEYLEARVMTAQPHQLHLMVLDGAIRYAKRAETAIDEEDYETAHAALNSSREFVGELISGLDPTHAPELVERLKALFVFVYRNLVEADLKRDSQAVRNALEVLQIHRDTWVALAQMLPAEGASEHGSAAQEQATATPPQPPRPHLLLAEQDGEADAKDQQRSWST